MITREEALSILPDGLRKPLLKEYQSILQNYMEHRWSPSELSGGRFCEIVYTILHGHARNNYQTSPSKPRDFVAACRALESNTGVPRSFQILVPRLLPALYEIRSNRGVGHVGGDVDPNHMDATAILAISNWVMAELVRVFHAVPVQEAQQVVDALVERKIPLVWQSGDIKRVLNPRLSLKDQVLVLVASCPSGSTVRDLLKWTEVKTLSYLNKTLQSLHKNRLIEFGKKQGTVELLPAGVNHVSRLLACQEQS